MQNVFILHIERSSMHIYYIYANRDHDQTFHLCQLAADVQDLGIPGADGRCKRDTQAACAPSAHLFCQQPSTTISTLHSDILSP